LHFRAKKGKIESPILIQRSRAHHTYPAQWGASGSRIMSQKIRILIADDHAVVRRGLALVLRQEPDFEIVGEASDGIEAVKMANYMSPDLVLLDWKMPRMDGLEAASQIRKLKSTVRTLLLSGAPIESAALDALDNGVDGFVIKDISPTELAYAVRVVASGKTYLSPDVTKALIKRSKQSSVAYQHVYKLTKREMEVLKLMATPATYSEIAQQLHIGKETVRTHAKRVMAKLGQPNRTQAVIEGLHLKLIVLDEMKR
jgi:DNA-binding NarL/FixJ family response regulator